VTDHLCGAGRRRARSTNVNQPSGGIELGVDGLQLPASGTNNGIGTGLDGFEDGDTLGRVGVCADLTDPSESNDTVTGDGISTQDGEADGGLGTLACDIGLGRWEGRPTERNAGNVVDRVGGVNQVRSEQVGGDGGIKVGQRRDPLGLNADGNVVRDTGRATIVASGLEGCWGSRDNSGQGNRSSDVGETHVDYV